MELLRDTLQPRSQRMVLPGMGSPARDLYFFWDFNKWDRHSHRMEKKDHGVWEIFLPYEAYKDTFVHESLVKVLVHGHNGWHERIPVYIRRIIQNINTKDFAGQLWFPPKKFNWQGDRFQIKNDTAPLIYECHVGMAQEDPRTGTYREFADLILPRVKEAGYNMVQVMAIAEHPYYGSFGYHVSNFFAPSSRFGTPEDLKYMILKAHQMDIGVIMDIVHSHTVKITMKGLMISTAPKGFIPMRERAAIIRTGIQKYSTTENRRLYNSSSRT